MLGSRLNYLASGLLALNGFSHITMLAEAKVAKTIPDKAGSTISMPDAYSGAKYDTTLDPGKVAWKQPAVCVPVPALPDWLKLDCSHSTFTFTGTVPTITTDTTNSFAITVIDAGNKQYAYKVKLTLRPTIETIPLTKAAAKEEAAEAAVEPDYSNLRLLQTAPISEGVTQAAGLILDLPPKAALYIQAWSQLEAPAGEWAQMALVNPTAPPATVQQVALKGNSYTLQFAQRLAAGQRIRLVAVKSDGTPIQTLLDQLLPSAIPIGTMRLTVEQPAVVGAKTVTGTLNSMPVPPVQPTPASGANPATYGNFPGVVVWWSDPASGKWSQAAPAVGGSPASFLSVNADGSFVVNLPSALQAGQQIRVDVVPPPGRSFTNVVAPSHLSETITVLSNVLLSQPTISSTPFTEGTTVISGTATIPSSGTPVGILVLRLRNQLHTQQGNQIPQMADHECAQVDQLGSQTLADIGRVLSLTSSSSNTLLGTIDATAGTYKVTLAEALKQDDWVQVVQVLPAGAVLPDSHNCASTPRRVTYPFEFHRTNISVVAGVLLSNSSSGSSTSANFSQANQFYAFNVDHAWALPGFTCFEDVTATASESNADKAAGKIIGKRWGQASSKACRDLGWQSLRWFRGNNSFFQGRLTSIPVSTAATTITPASNASSTTTSPNLLTPQKVFRNDTPASSASSTTTSPTLLTSQKVFRVETGIFLPWVVSHGSGDHPQGLFVAPLAKAGFDTITGAGTSNNVILPGGSVGLLDFQTAYKYYAYGARLGNMALSQSPNRAPLIEDYFDVTIGRYSNLQSFICHHAVAGSPHAQPGSSCGTDYPNIFKSANDIVDSRKQLYRLDFEGLVRIPIPATAVPFYIGFNANISQHTWQAEYLDHGYAPPDDIRILLGTRIDIGTLLTSLKLTGN